MNDPKRTGRAATRIFGRNTPMTDDIRRKHNGLTADCCADALKLAATLEVELRVTMQGMTQMRVAAQNLHDQVALLKSQCELQNVGGAAHV